MLGAALVALAVVGALSWGVWQQIDRLRELAAAEADLAPLIAYEQQQNKKLRRMLDHVSSPDYPEEWARVHAGMTRPGEVRLVVSLPEEPTPPSLPAQSPTPSIRQGFGEADQNTTFWQRLWQWLLGND